MESIRGCDYMYKSDSDDYVQLHTRIINHDNERPRCRLCFWTRGADKPSGKKNTEIQRYLGRNVFRVTCVS